MPNEILKLTSNTETKEVKLMYSYPCESSLNCLSPVELSTTREIVREWNNISFCIRPNFDIHLFSGAYYPE